MTTKSPDSAEPGVALGSQTPDPCPWLFPPQSQADLHPGLFPKPKPAFQDPGLTPLEVVPRGGANSPPWRPCGFGLEAARRHRTAAPVAHESSGRRREIRSVSLCSVTDFSLFWAAPRGLRALSSLTRDGTCAVRQVLTPERQGTPHYEFLTLNFCYQFYQKEYQTASKKNPGFLCLACSLTA